MEYKNLGASGLIVSRLCLGTFNFFHVTSEVEALALLDKAEDLGINFIDTANIYGKEKSVRGAAETLIGNWLQKKKDRRHKFVVGTKVSGLVDPAPNNQGLSAYHIQQACDDSLRRLQTDHIDLYQMHKYDPKTPIDETLQAFDVLIKQGKVLYLGSSNFAAWQIMKFQSLAKQHGLYGLISEQSVYNLTERTVELEVLPAVRNEGIGFLPWSPLAGGLLAGTLNQKSIGRRLLDHKKAEFDKFHSSLCEYETLCTRINAKPAHLALAWLLHNESITAPIIGARNAEQLEDSAKCLDLKLDMETIQQLDQIWRSPGEAPDVYTKWGQPR